MSLAPRTHYDPPRLPPLCALLDPRCESDAAASPIWDAANIPVDELRGRTHELPPATVVMQVADVDSDAGGWAAAAVEELKRLGRNGVVTSEWGFAPAGRAGGRLWRPTGFLENCVRHCDDADGSGSVSAPELEHGQAEYRLSVPPGRLSVPPDCLSVPPGRASLRALDLACGTGRDAVFLAAQGWRVTAVDHDASALARGEDLARRYAPLAPPIEWVLADVEGWAGAVQPFDLVTCFRYLSRDLFRRLPGLIAPGGSLLLEVFTPEYRARHGRPQSVERVASVEELVELVQPLQVEFAAPEWREDVHTARVWASKRYQNPRASERRR